jgi:hypothetical protein
VAKEGVVQRCVGEKVKNEDKQANPLLGEEGVGGGARGGGRGTKGENPTIRRCSLLTGLVKISS